MRKNVASQTISAMLITSAGAVVTSGTTTVYVTGDGGTQGSGGGTVAHEGQGCWSYVPTQPETNYNHIAFTFTNDTANTIPANINVYTISFDPHDTAALGLTTLTGHVPQTGDTYALANGANGFVNIKSDTASILTDTGTTLDAALAVVDSNVDAIKAKTDSLTFTVANQVDANALAFSGSTVAADNAKTSFTGTITSLDALDTAQDAQHSTTLSKLLKYVQLILRKDAAIATDNATEVTAINADGGSGAGAFANTTDSQEAIRDNQLAATSIVSGGAITTSGGAVSNVTTVATLAGHTPQSGDSFAKMPTNYVMGSSDQADHDGDFLTTAQVNTEVDNAIVTYGLDHLVSASVTGTDVADDSIIAKMVSKSATADWDSYANTTDALEAIRDRGDTAWAASSSSPFLLQTTTIATLATQTSFTLSDGSTDDDAYNGAIAVFTDVLTATQKAFVTISDYTGSTKTVTLSSAPAFAIAATDTIDIVAASGITADAVWAAGTRTLTAATNITSDASAINVTSGVVDRVTLTDTTTTNTDMRGTDNAALASNWTATRAGYVDTLNTGVALSAASVDAIWDEIISNSAHNTANSAGKLLRQSSKSFVVHDGTAQAGAATTITLDTGASTSDDFYNHRVITIVDGTGVGQSRLIIDYVGSTRVATVDESWSVNPDATSEFSVYDATSYSASDHNVILAGRAASATSTTIVLNSDASAIDDFYKHMSVAIEAGTGAGQVNLIASYTGSTKTCTMEETWLTTPDSTSVFHVVSAKAVVGAYTTGGLADVNAEMDTAISDAALATASALATVDSNVDAILVDTGTTIPAQITALNNVSSADVNAACDTAISDWATTAIATATTLSDNTPYSPHYILLKLIKEIQNKMEIVTSGSTVAEQLYDDDGSTAINTKILQGGSAFDQDITATSSDITQSGANSA